MKISSILTAIAAALAAQAEPEGGSVWTSTGPEDTDALLLESPAKWRIILHWGGDEPADETTDAWVATRIVCTVQQPRALQRIGGRDLTESVSGRAAFYDRVDQVRRWMRGIVFYRMDGDTAVPHEFVDCRGLMGGSCQPLILERDGAAVPETRQAELNFFLRHALPHVTEIAAVVAG